jgi:asparagine N-glycosylation enzyme membrane subunit Stt3
MVTDAGWSEVLRRRPPAARSLRLARALALIALAGCGFWFRVAGARDVVFPPGSAPRLLGTDAYDHLRRAAELAGALSPDLAPWPMSAADWVEPGLFDGLLALPAWATAGPEPTLEELITGAAWVPPALGALSIVALFALARRFLPPIDAWFTALLFLLYPGESLDRTTLGFADHHAIEILLTLVALWALVRHLQAGRDRPWWRPAPLAAAPAAALLLVWRGAALTLGLIALGLGLLVLVELTAGRDVRRLVHRMLGYGTGLALLMALVRAAWPQVQLDPVTMGRAWLAVGALLAVPGLAWILRAAGSGRRGIAAYWLAAGGLALAAVGVLAAPPGQRLLQVLTTARTANVQEHQAIDLRGLASLLGGTALYALPGLVIAIVAVVRRRLDATLVVVLVVAGGWSAVWWRVHDVGYLPPALLALPAGCLLWGVKRWSLARVEGTAGRGPLRLAGVLALVPIVALAVAPLWPYGLAAAPATTAARSEALVVYRPADFEAARWLRDHAPSGGGHAVAAPWFLGNLVATVGERRPLWARMPSRTAGEWLLAPSEEESIAILARASAGDPVLYAVIDGRSCGSFFVAEARNAGSEPRAVGLGARELGSERVPLWGFDATYTSSLAAGLCFGDGSGLSRYRLRWQSASRVVTVYRMRADHDSGGGSALVGLETRVLAKGETPPPPEWLNRTPDGKWIVYGPRVHREARIFEIVPPRMKDD